MIPLSRSLFHYTSQARRIGRSAPVRILGAVLVALLALGAILVSGSPESARAATTVRVMPLGDSITGSPGCWRQLLWARLQSTGYPNVDFVGSLDNSQSCGTLYDGGNEGHGGILARDILSQNQLPGWLASARPDVVMVQLATNDIWNNIPATAILSTFGSLVDQMRANNPSMRIVVAKILPMNPTNCAECGQRVITLNNAIPAWAASKSTAASPITVVDTWTGFTTATDTSDGVHPNQAGNQKMSNSWYPALIAAVDSVGGTPPVTPTTTTSPIQEPPTTTPPNPATLACSAGFTLGSSWNGGFTGTVKVTAGPTAISKWTVGRMLPTGTTITNLWNGALSGSSVSSTWNGSVPAGGSVEFGFQGSGTVTGVAVASCAAG